MAAALSYSPTLSSAMAFGEAGQLDVWIHRFLTCEANNVPFSDGLKLCERYYVSPAPMPLGLFSRCVGPEEGMAYRVDGDAFSKRVANLERLIRAGTDLPPLIAHYVDGRFELNDGNHRYKAYENLGVESAWVIVWITGESEFRDYMEKHGVFTKDCVIVRR
ncbi:MAG: ParB-like nuclease domain-containing protein [Clostridia bacterium]|nr:ParB-like nuclease domain-containing protein [Clostridia bacterium]